MIIGLRPHTEPRHFKVSEGEKERSFNGSSAGTAVKELVFRAKTEAVRSLRAESGPRF